MGKYDVIIIGSGLGGLVSGYILSKNGYKVAILEQNDQYGGCLQSFTRKGVKYETGMHYIGSMQEGEALHRFFNYLSLLPDLTLRQLDQEGYDVISFRDQRYRFANGHEQFVEELSRSFPSEHANLRKYSATIQQIADSSPMYSFKKMERAYLLKPDHVKTSVDEFVETITTNEQLRNVLVGNLPLYAGRKGKTPLYIHALINDFYLHGAYRVVGGSDLIAHSLVRSIQRFGGEVFTKSQVTKIHCDEHQVTAVELADGRLFDTKTLISNVHPDRTLEMLESRMIRPAYRERIHSLEQTISNFTVYLRFKKETVPYMNSNFYHCNTQEMWGAEAYRSDDWPRSFLYMHLCHSLHSPYAEGAELIAYMRFDEVRRWIGSSVGRRGADYLAFKEEKATQLMASLERQFPGILSMVEGYYTSSPLTYLDYTGTKEGSMYGVVRDKNFPAHTLISQRTKIPNFFFTGQNINSHGILGVIIGSVITCAELLGKEFLVQQIIKANQ